MLFRSAPATPKAEAEVKAKVEAPASHDGECIDTVARAAISRLVVILENNGTIEEEEKEEVLGILGGKIAVSAAPSEEYKPKSASPYSDDEIDDMFTGMGVN